jgi:hypothetical protein
MIGAVATGFSGAAVAGDRQLRRRGWRDLGGSHYANIRREAGDR